MEPTNAVRPPRRCGDLCAADKRRGPRRRHAVEVKVEIELVNNYANVRGEEVGRGWLGRTETDAEHGVLHTKFSAAMYRRHPIHQATCRVATFIHSVGTEDTRRETRERGSQ